MSLQIGQQLGSYEITSLIGRGGMGEVYRARDSKLKRDVAIKAIPDELSRDHDRVIRFQREAEVLASLNHSNIASVYDLQEANESRFLIMELVEGDTLAERIARGPLPIEEALDIAKQICEALEAAHEKGIVHRDLKPANIKLTPDLTVKVLDFGLAKVSEAHGGATALSNSPTLMSASMPGTILGTAGYMSPEQARGKEADRSSDMWAFGCIMYEMLTGHAVFQGESVGEILAGVFKGEPDWSRLPARTTEGVRRLVRRCLQKDEKLRLRDMRDARIEVQDALNEPPPDLSVPKTYRSRERFVWISVTVLAVVVAATFGMRAARVSPPAEMRLEITTRPAAMEGARSVAISPDGRKIVFVGSSGGRPTIWLRYLDSGTSQVLKGTDGALLPFWSPDSRSIGFFADDRLKRIDIDGG
jgi:eukaryotic-like serine/threonine-protein kinase